MAEYIDKEEILKMTNSYKNELGRLKADPFVKCGIETVEGFINEQPIADVIPIPKVATNGDMIKAVFPSSEVRETMDDLVHYTLDGYVGAYTTKDWWNAAYKAESEE